MKKLMKSYKKSRETASQADISLGKLLLGLTHLSENLCAPPEKPKLVYVNLSKLGVERLAKANGCSEIILWSQLENQNPLNSHISKLFTKHCPRADTRIVGFKKNNSIEVKFTIHRTYFSIGIDTDLLSSCNFFMDVFNLITYRGGKVRVRVRLLPTLRGVRLTTLMSGDHDYSVVEMHPTIVSFASFVQSLWVIVLKESSSSDLTNRSSSDFSNMEDLSLWKVWNWRLNGYYPNFDSFNEDDLEMYQNDVYSFEMQDTDAIMDNDVSPFDVDFDPDGDEFSGGTRGSCIYPKEFILALRDHPLSRKKPENIEHINIMVKSYNGYQMSQGGADGSDEEVRKYSKKFLLSLRYAPLSLRRPDCPEHAFGANLSPMQCFKKAREAAAYRHYDKDPLSPPWFPPLSSRRHYDRVHCTMQYKRY